MPALWQRLLELVRRGRLDRELDEEVALHLQMLEEEFRRKGMDWAAARAAARREFGGEAQVKEAYRDERGVSWIETALRDIRYALRGLRRNPGFTLAAVLSIALGIGANTAVFSLFYALMLRTLPVARPAELVTLYRTGGWGKGFSSYPLYLELAKRTDLFTGVLARTAVEKVRYTPPGGRPQFAQREMVSGNYFQVLGVKPAIGRLFTQEDNRTPGAHPLAVLSYEYWHSELAGDPGVLGRTARVDEQPLTIIGVAAPGFRGVDIENHTKIWVPATMSRVQIMDTGTHWIWMIARRRPELSPRQVQAAVDVLIRAYLTRVYGNHPEAVFRNIAMGQRLEVREGGIGLSMLRDQFGRPLTLLMGAVLLVLLAACANVANLVLARGAARQKEIALRLSLGATRARLVGQALTESLLLAAAGGLLGILLASWGERGILRFVPENEVSSWAVAPDGVVLAFTLGISALSAILFGLAPAWRSTSIDPAPSLHSAGGVIAGGTRARRALVVVQVAFSVILVSLGGLLGHSLAALRSVDLGFRNPHVIAFSFDFARTWKGNYREAAERLKAELESVPGITAASYGSPGPFQGGTADIGLRVPGSQRTAQAPADVQYQRVGPGYFEIIGSAVISGREFTRHDMATSPKVALVNQAFVRTLLPDEPHPVGRVLSFDDGKPEGGAPIQIVGLVHDIAHQGLREKIEPAVYVPFAQSEEPWPPEVLVRTQMPQQAILNAVYQALGRIGPQPTLLEFGTIQERIDTSIFQERLLAALGGLFGGLALVLAVIGLYGVVAYGTAQRSGEFGVRIALGAQRRDVLWTVLRDALMLVAAGVAIGLPLALAAGRATTSVLFGIKPSDPLAFVSTAAVLLVVGAGAAFLPARRAASIDPMRALRHE